jgi:ribonuclease BN (tRNA processing enzyme)
MGPGDTARVGKDWIVTAGKSRHFVSDGPGRHRSLSYQVARVSTRLRPDLRSLSQAEIDAARLSEGREAIMVEEHDPYFIVSGDTVPLTVEDVGATPYLLHECTFLEQGHGGRAGGHTELVELLEALRDAPLERLLLYHISKRFDRSDGVARIETECRRRKIGYPVAAVFSGEVAQDAFSRVVYEPS